MLIVDVITMNNCGTVCMCVCVRAPISHLYVNFLNAVPFFHLGFSQFRFSNMQTRERVKTKKYRNSRIRICLNCEIARAPFFYRIKISLTTAAHFSFAVAVIQYLSAFIIQAINVFLLACLGK